MAVMLCVNFVACDDDDDDKDPVTPPVELPDNSGNNNSNNDSSTLQECPTCDGSGDCQGSNCDSGYCFQCDGTGYEYEGDYKFICPWCERGKCPACNGRNKCTKCNGKGYIN